MIKIVEYNSELSKEMIKKLEHRSQFEHEPILMTVREILTDVRETGDNAVVNIPVNLMRQISRSTIFRSPTEKLILLIQKLKKIF